MRIPIQIELGQRRRMLAVALLITTSCSLASRDPSRAPKEASESGLAGYVRIDRVETHLFDCFPRASEKRCESSAVVNLDRRLLIASDKHVDPPYSPLFWMASHNPTAKPVEYLTRGPLLEARKIEEIAVGPEDGLVFATTDFNWPTSDGELEPDAYNTLLVWRENPATAQVVEPSVHLGKTSSRGLRTRFARALADEADPSGPPYFKIEGMAALPGRRLLFGVRETGPDYEHPRYRHVILQATYTLTTDGIIVLSDSFSKVIDFSTEPEAEPTGVSALLYDPQRRGLWIVATHEVPEGEQGHFAKLWWTDWNSAKPDDLRPAPVLSSSGEPFVFPHKIEGITLLEDGRLFGVCDEDRTPSQLDGGRVREMHQGIYVILHPAPDKFGSSTRGDPSTRK